MPTDKMQELADAFFPAGTDLRRRLVLFANLIPRTMLGDAVRLASRIGDPEIRDLLVNGLQSRIDDPPLRPARTKKDPYRPPADLPPKPRRGIAEEPVTPETMDRWFQKAGSVAWSEEPAGQPLLELFYSWLPGYTLFNTLYPSTLGLRL
jgi:hypothetical protein